MTALWNDIRYGVRMLAKRPGFTLTAAVAWGAGIGANTALFSVVRGALFSPLPFSDSERLVLFQTGWRSTSMKMTCSGPDYLDWVGRRSRVMDGPVRLCSVPGESHRGRRAPGRAGLSRTPRISSTCSGRGE